ncbi:LRWD1 [Branchiostoma lanceolatum]|uniref:Leucine-rich repeat and WD repeat-containing protein 1 n=1 Tax=Branchiostoma lanceolatum TaxID=7740 RepID=A0A8J9YPH3_BRALA|nr:LRWD1 [Branchiostoma lanceolatum]
MPPSPAALVTKELILQKTGCKQLSDVEKLDLSDLGLETIDGDLFSQMPNLQDLNLSKNKLAAFPEHLGLGKLQVLDVSDNRMRSFLSLAQFQELEQVNIQDNPYTAADREQLTFLLPRLKSVDGETIQDNHRQYLKRVFGTSLEEKVEGLWEAQFKKLFRMSQSAGVQRLLQDQFIQTAKQKIQAGPASMEQLRDWRIETIASKLVAEQDLNTVKGEASMSSKRSHDDSSTNGASSDAVAPSKKPRNVTPKDDVTSAADNVSNNKTVRSRNARVQIEILPKTLGTTLAKKVVRKPATKRGSSTLTLCSKDSTADYEPSHILQCHSVKNNRDDMKTMVWKCVFEPNPDNTEESTSIVATCGGESVCLLDCRTGKIVQKFSQPREDFFCVAWMTIPLDGKSEKMTNILVVGGKRGKIYLIHPQQNIWYAEHEAHRRDICSMVVYPDQPSWMYTGSYDKTIRLWDISPPKLPNYECRIRKLAEWSPPSIPLHMLLFPDRNLLLAACRSGCFSFMLNHKEDDWKKTYTTEFTFPKVKKCTEDGEEVETEFMDNMTLISSEVIASKLVGHGCIYLWNLPATLKRSAKIKGPRSLKVQPVAQLEWSKTFLDYIYFKMWPGYDVLVCGDDVGNTWMYDVSKFLTRKWPEDTPVPPAQKLSWPDCTWNGTRLSKESDEDEVSTVVSSSSSMSEMKLPSVNDIAISSSGDYIVGVTDCNLVFVWRKDKPV